MRHYVLNRVLGAVFVIWIVSVLIFLMMHLLPGDTLMALLGQRGGISDEAMAEIRSDLGIDRPLYVQYVSWVTDIFDGSMGRSLIYRDRTVRSRITRALPVTVEFALLSMLFAVVTAIPLGVLSAIRRDGVIDNLIRFVSLLGISLPQFWVGIVIVIYGTLYFGYAPNAQFVSITTDPIGNLKDMWIPVVVLGSSVSAIIIRFLRSAMLEVMNQDFVRTARAKGLREGAVLYRHVLRNALIPVVTVIGIQTAFLFSGTLILEILFNFPGLGQLTYNSIIARDYTQVQGVAFVITVIVVGVNLLVDLSYGVIDPRVRL